MAVKQISVLLGNVPGTLSRLTNILDREDITALRRQRRGKQHRGWSSTTRKGRRRS
jgi:hypothetical protein